MLTTSDKLRCKPTKEVIIPHLSVQGFTNIDFKEIFQDGHPSRFMKSLFSGSTLKEELDESYNDEEQTQNNDQFIEMRMYIPFAFRL